jgi:hypothetical protein
MSAEDLASADIVKRLVRPLGMAEERKAEPTQRRFDEVFGDVLPETTADERDERTSSSSGDDSWYLENRPPHHDR